jgi:RNA polymerase II-associated protein 1
MPLPDPTATTLRFNLHGALILPKLSISLLTHLGLHHHSEGMQAGYTLDDVFLLTCSTIPAQCIAMLGVIAGIVRRLAGMWQGISKNVEWRNCVGMKSKFGRGPLPLVQM